MSKENLSYLKGEYTWSTHKKRVYGHVRCVMTISKGGKMVGFICWHPTAKQLVYNAYTAQTKDHMEFVAEKMKRFYFCVKLDRLLNSQDIESHKKGTVR